MGMRAALVLTALLLTALVLTILMVSTADVSQPEVNIIKSLATVCTSAPLRAWEHGGSTSW
jgi:hypothetical protein